MIYLVLYIWLVGAFINYILFSTERNYATLTKREWFEITLWPFVWSFAVVVVIIYRLNK